MFTSILSDVSERGMLRTAGNAFNLAAAISAPQILPRLSLSSVAKPSTTSELLQPWFPTALKSCNQPAGKATRSVDFTNRQPTFNHSMKPDSEPATSGSCRIR